MNRISAISNSFNHILEIVPERSQAVKNISRIAIPLTILYGASLIPKSDGGPVTYAAYVLSCETISVAATAGTAASAALVACANGCLYLLAVGP